MNTAPRNSSKTRTARRAVAEATPLGDRAQVRVDWAAVTDGFLIAAGALVFMAGLHMLYPPLAWIAAGLYLIVLGMEGQP